MFENFFWVFLLVIAASMVFRDEAFFTLTYLLMAVFLIGRWWGKHALETICVQRQCPSRVFLGEDVPVTVEVQQKGWLPLVWLRMQEKLPQGLGCTGTNRQVVSLGPKGKARLEYQLFASRRGYYRLGPLSLLSGDPFGISGEYSTEDDAHALIIYPRVVDLSALGLPSRSPMGAIKHQLPIYEDPSRVLSKRDYQSGDSLRRIDWKSSASVGRLQVKQFEPSISLEVMLFLNLNAMEYELHTRYDATELGIVVAASMANWAIARGQAVGLCTNGLDPLGAEEAAELRDFSFNTTKPVPAHPLNIGKGQQHLMRVLEILARIQAASEESQAQSFLELVRKQRSTLPWGATLLMITGQVDEALFGEIFSARRQGLIPVIIMIGKVPGVQTVQEQAEFLNIAFYHIPNELELDQWRTARPDMQSLNLSLGHNP
jgi:uncharacterized protein (DUF58 family)